MCAGFASPNPPDEMTPTRKELTTGLFRYKIKDDARTEGARVKRVRQTLAQKKTLPGLSSKDRHGAIHSRPSPLYWAQSVR